MEISKVPSSQPDRNARSNVPRRRRKGARQVPEAPARPDEEHPEEESAEPQPRAPGHRIDVTA
jgi:hypothetical protein